MELKELTEKMLDLFGVSSCDDLGEALMNCALSNNTEQYNKFSLLVEDLSVDWLQKIYQYYHADRKDKKQDYTPKSVAELMARLCGTSDVVIDMCAGSGALTIQKWNTDKNSIFWLYELDSAVFPYLVFNMAVRNIECVIHNADVLQDEIYKSFCISRGEIYGIMHEVTK
jgi:type I restriction enzyme M protein